MIGYKCITGGEGVDTIAGTAHQEGYTQGSISAVATTGCGGARPIRYPGAALINGLLSTAAP